MNPLLSATKPNISVFSFVASLVLKNDVTVFNTKSADGAKNKLNILHYETSSYEFVITYNYYIVPYTLPNILTFFPYSVSAALIST